MHRRPISPQFNDAICEGRKVTTIRRSPWPVGVPIQLYNWSGKPYASKQVPVAVVMCRGHNPVTIQRDAEGAVSFGVWGQKNKSIDAEQLTKWEGFACQEDLEAWFRRLVKPGKPLVQFLNRFELFASIPPALS